MNTPKPLPPQELLNQLLEYNPQTGKLYWKKREERFFARASEYTRWNNRYAGKEACNKKCDGGYLIGSIFKNLYKTHRLIWKLYYGTEPEQIDHINGKRNDNKISNLRAATAAINAKNAARRKDNKSRITGVFWDKKSKKWRASINVNNKKICLGCYDSLDAAAIVRNCATQTYGFNKNHGREAALC